MRLKERDSVETEDDYLKVLEILYKKYYNLLYNYGLKFVNDSKQVEDFIQNIFVKLCRRDNLHHIDDFKIYLLRAMRNTVYDYYGSLNNTFSIDDIEFSLTNDEESFRNFFAKDDEEIRQWQYLLKAINALKAQQKMILYLFYIKGLSHKEIGEILDILPQSSMNSLSKTIRKLQKELREE